MRLPVIVIGSGGHAKVLIEALLLNNVKVLGIADADLTQKGKSILGISVIGDDNAVFKHVPGEIQLVNGIGSVGLPIKRQRVFDKFKDKGFNFTSVIHPSAVIASDAEIYEGAQIMAGVVIQPGSRIGKDAIVNTKASIDHDCSIGDHVHISPGVTLSGGVTVGDIVHIGTGVTVIQGIKIGNNSLIGAGSVVINNVPDNDEVAGVPARSINIVIRK